MRFGKRAMRALGAALFFFTTAAFAQSYPSKPIRFIVPFTPGTGIDILARTLAEPLAKRVGQPLVVENKPGASGNIGSDFVAKAPPDGYTVMVTVNTFTMAPALYKSMSFDPINDFVPIGEVAVGNLALVVHPSLGVASVSELIALAKKEPGKLNYASPGNGTPQHLAMELLKQSLGIDIVHVPYKGSAGAVTDVVAGQVPMMIMPVHTALPFATSGKLKVLAVSGDKRSALAHVVNVLDPVAIVLGGGLSNIERLYSSVPKLWGRWIFSDAAETALLCNMHGDSSGVRGAARLWDKP